MKNWSGLKKLMMLHAATGGGLTEYEATGNPATFETNVAKVLPGMTIPFTPIQSGSGDPSPTNIRPISGKSSVTVYRSGQDISDPTTYSISFPAEPGTIYGGYVDLTHGVVVAEWKGVDMGDLTWTFLNQNGNRQAWETRSIDDRKQIIASDMYNGYCEILKPSSANGTWMPYQIVQKSNSTTTCICFSPSAYETGEDVQEAVRGKKLIYELDAPITYPLSSVSIPTTLNGQNVIWTDTNGTNTVKYLKKE